MKKILFYSITCVILLIAFSCKKVEEKETKKTEEPSEKSAEMFKLYEDPNRFADLRVLQYKVPGFDKLTPQQKELVYYLSQAALSGRDIIWDQNYRHNLYIRKAIEAITDKYTGDRNTENFKRFMEYAKRVWFSNGIHHHYSKKKIMPGFSQEYFKELIKNSPEGNFPLTEGETLDDLVETLTPILFDPEVDSRTVNKDKGADNVLKSANNYYGVDITAAEAEAFYADMKDESIKKPISYGLNSKLVKEDGKLVEKVWKIGGMYTEAIEKIVYWLEKAVAVAENDQQKKALALLVEYYKTGDLNTFDQYNIAWVKDTKSVVDVINGFIEVYGDAIGYRGAFESVVSIKDFEASELMQGVSEEVQWFEDNSPIMDAHKKKKVKGVSYKVITVVTEAGDAAPSTPIGINLPNSNWIRADHGSKSVSLGNILEAYDAAIGAGSLAEFTFTEEEKERAEKHGELGGKMHTALHEVVGHASGQLNPGVGTPKETLKTYASTLEEGRADLVALYYLMDPKLVEMGLIPSLDVGKAEYDGYIRNGMMTQLRRIAVGENIEEDHMRNRQLVAQWAYEKGQADNVIEKKIKDGKTFFVVNDYEKLRVLFGELLREIQRIKSEGDYAAAEQLVETYGVKVDQELHKEVLERYKKFDLAAYSGFIQPKLVPVTEGDKIVDVKVEYPTDFAEQMMEYGKKYAFLPIEN